MEEGTTEIGRQRSEKRRMEQAKSAPGRPPGRPVSTGLQGVHRKKRSTDPARPTPLDRLKWLCFRVDAVDRAGRPTGATGLSF